MSSTKGALRWLWNQVSQVFHRMRGGKIDKIVGPTPTLRDRFLFVERNSGHMAGLHKSVLSGDMSIQQWVLGFRARLKGVYIDQYVMARGGRAAMTQRDWGRLGAMLKKQYGFMNRFGEDIAAGKLTEAQMARRSQMYFDSARQAFERGKEESLGMPTLPAYPADGQTQCLSNCQCYWDIRETEDEWLATWTLGAAEHCPDCVENAERWAPLRLRK